MASHYMLQTDARPADNKGPAAIGAVLRQRHNGRLVVLDFVSKTIEPTSVGVAEYKALIAGLELARKHGAGVVRAYVDAHFLADQVNKEKPRLRPEFKELHAAVRGLMEGLDIRISWVPREMNIEADQRVGDALIR